MRTLWRAVLALAVAALMAASFLRPVDATAAGAGTQFTVALFAALLTGEAVVFALSFSAAGVWPSLREIDRHIAFRQWVLIGAVAATLIAVGLMWNLRAVATLGAELFLASNVIGAYSFIRLMGIAGADGRARLLTRALAGALRDPAGALGSPVVDAYLATLDQAVSSGDPGALRDLTRQLAAARVEPGDPVDAFAVHLIVIRSLARAMLLRGGDPDVLGGCLDEVMRAVVRDARNHADPDMPLGALSRQLAWLARIARALTDRGACDPRAARHLIVRCVNARKILMRVMDPDPMSPESEDELGTPFADPVRLAAWLRAYAEFSGSGHPTAFYGVYEILAGRKFVGDYVYGDSILAQLRGDLYGPASPAGELPRSTLAVFKSADAFDLFWCRLSIVAISTMNDVRLSSPAEFAEPAARRGPTTIAAELRTYATHRWFATAEDGATLLSRLASQTPEPDSLWARIEARRPASLFGRPPEPPETDRGAAMVLAVACRLAPLEPGQEPDELERFLASLPESALAAAGALAARILPGAEDCPAPIDRIVTGLRILMEIGAHLKRGRA